MYLKGQIVWDIKNKCLIQADDIDYTKPHVTTHLLRAVVEKRTGDIRYIITSPESIEAAQELLDTGRIFPAPLLPTHCHRCGNWKVNHNKDGSCWR